VETGVQENCNYLKALDSGFRRNDGKTKIQTFYETILIGRNSGEVPYRPQLPPTPLFYYQAFKELNTVDPVLLCQNIFIFSARF
jgi:hypothetical protein